MPILYLLEAENNVRVRLIKKGRAKSKNAQVIKKILPESYIILEEGIKIANWSKISHFLLNICKNNYTLLPIPDRKVSQSIFKREIIDFPPKQ